MPVDRKLYPADWPSLAREVKRRARWRCACRGECGARHFRKRCGAPHDGVIVRDSRKPWRWKLSHMVYSDEEANRAIRVVLTVAHLNHNPKDSRPSNLVAMCQRCHLHYDRELHRWSRTRTAEKAVGQMRLLPRPPRPEGQKG